MKEHPIIFNTEMIRAILDGRKTQTRRVIKPQPTIARYFQTHHPKQMPQYSKTDNYIPHPDGGWAEIGSKYGLSTCPYGQPSDRLWVRETWAARRHNDEEKPSRINPAEKVWFKTTSLGDRTVYSGQRADGAGKWRPSIYMPRWASRITLEITEVRVERLQEIIRGDIEAEGIVQKMPPGYTYWAGGYLAVNGIYGEFAKLWNSLNAKHGYGWETNSWVWVISFRRLDNA